MTTTAMPPAMAERIVKRTLAGVAAKWPKARGQRIIAIGRSDAGQPFKVTTPPDWPTDDEIEEIIQRNRRFDNMAACIRTLFDPEDWAIYTMDAGLEARAEERRSQF